MISREKLSHVLATSPRRYVHAFGCSSTCGFGADFLGLLNALMACLNLEIGFVLTMPKRPQGFAFKEGWNDYFQPLFEMVDAPFMQQLNRHYLPLHSRLPILRVLASAWLRSFTRPRSTYFCFDNITSRGTSRVPQLLNECSDWLHARSELMKLIWLYNESTRDRVEKLRNELNLPEYYHSVHIRRGDKNTEFDYVSIDKYLCALCGKSDQDTPLFVTSDDYECINNLQKAMPARKIFTLTKPAAAGYFHKQFKALPPEERKDQTCLFLAQLECLWNAELFIGSNTTNVAWLVNAYRAGENVVWAD